MNSNQGVWVQTTDGRYIWDQKDGWYFDHLTQRWFLEDAPPSTPTGAPAAATRKRFVSRLLTWPEDSIFWVHAHPRVILREGGFLGPILGVIVFCISWVARIAVVYSGYQILKAWTVGSDGGWLLTHYLLGAPEPDENVPTFVYVIVYVALAVFALIILAILSLNAEQSATLTTAFVAHRMSRHFAQQVADAQVRAAGQHPTHYS